MPGYAYKALRFRSTHDSAAEPPGGSNGYSARVPFHRTEVSLQHAENDMIPDWIETIGRRYAAFCFWYFDRATHRSQR